MVIGKTIDGSYFYAKEVFLGKWQKWILLLCSCILFPLFLGYSMRIYRGANPAPELNDWGGMFIDGIKLMIVGAIFALPVLILDFVLIGSTSLVLLSNMNTYPGGMYIPPNAIMGLLVAVFPWSINHCYCCNYPRADIRNCHSDVLPGRIVFPRRSISRKSLSISAELAG